MKSVRFWLSAFCAAAITAQAASAALIAEYQADNLAAGSSPTAVTSWTDSSGKNNNATTGNSGKAAPSVLGSGTAGFSNTAFNGHQYVAFNGDGLATATSLFSGTDSRSVVIVYQDAVAPTNSVDALAGETGAPNDHTWFVLQSRQDGNATGDPYMAAHGGDISDPAAPVANRLTFAVATYDGITAKLFYAFGTAGSVTNVSSTGTYTTNNDIFTLGYDTGGESSSNVLIADVRVYDTAIDGASEIAALQTVYATPEPASLALGALGAVGLLARRRRRAAC